MKGFKDKSGKFRPTENNNGVRKSRDQTLKIQGVRLERDRDDYPLILESNLETFNRNHSIQLEYGDAGGQSKGLKFKGTNSFIVGKMTKSQAIDTVQLLDRYLSKAGAPRLKREDHLPESIKNKISSNLVDLEIMTRDLREQSRVKHALGEPTGQVDSELNLIAGARNNIFSLLEQINESDHKMIIEGYDQELKEYLPR